MHKYIDIDASLYIRAERGCGQARKAVLQLVIDHVEGGIPMPNELQHSLVDILARQMHRITSDHGFHENGYEAWENAQSVQEALVSGAARSVEDACHHVAQQILAESGRKVSEETIKKHWNQFAPYARQGELPPLELLGDLSRGRQGKKK